MTNGMNKAIFLIIISASLIVSLGINNQRPDMPITVEVDIRVRSAESTESSWLRMAIASAFNDRGDVKYVELDFFDNYQALNHEKGNIGLGGNVIYSFGDVVEFRHDSIVPNEWTHYSFDLSHFFRLAWGEGGVLESVYVVIEAEGGNTESIIDIDNFVVTRGSVKFDDAKNYHCVGALASWNVTFGDYTTIKMSTDALSGGHVAIGIWVE